MKSRVKLEIKLLRILHKTVLIFFDLRLSTQGVILENQRKAKHKVLRSKGSSNLSLRQIFFDISWVQKVF